MRVLSTWLQAVYVLALCAASGLSQTPSSITCPLLSKDISQRIENYLGQRLVSGASLKPSVKSIDLVADSCYRKITLTIPGTSGDVVMYLSPDERFLSATLFDLSSDPQKEVERIAANVSKLLMRDNSPRLMQPSSRITLVEFVDFQCPYSKQLADWYEQLPAALRDQTALVFKNLPLAQHRWARAGAAYAVCANSQSASAFREVTDLFFQKQSEITPDNLKDKLSMGLGRSNVLNLKDLEDCIARSDASQIIDRDMAIAKQLNVNNTPTLFINGRRVMRVTSAQELQHLLETELANTDSTRAQTTGFSPVVRR